MKKYYECHLTFKDDPLKVKEYIEAIKWKFSCIDGDIILGEGVKCYGTMHYSISKYFEAEIVKIVNDLADTCIELGLNCIRKKVELVLFDKVIKNK